MDLDALPSWLQGRRWFGGKGRPIRAVRAVDRARVGDALLVVTLQVDYAGGGREHYLLPLPPTGELEEALVDDAAARAVLDLIRERRTTATEAGALRGERFDGAGSPLDQLPGKPVVRRLSAEQSNTSIVFADRVIVKLIRKLEQGVNPELEVGAHLALRRFAATPTLLGALTLSGAVDATVAVAHRFVKVDSDGWSYVLQAFRDQPLPAPSLLAEIRDLGARVGQLHAALADAGGDPAFDPEPIRRQDLLSWSETLSADLDRTISMAKAAVPQLEGRRAALQARIDRLRGLEPSGQRIRQHGDLHLGQVLRSEGQWLIFDFEGEPARPLPERRMKSSPFKDVAGMLRSFAYAAGTVQLEGGAAGDRLTPARNAFLDGYRSCASPLLPRDESASRALLDAFELEKLLYELRYEIGHRPEWIRIPARDLLAEDSR
jgi:trehalose synthase-fused probable maltokinase